MWQLTAYLENLQSDPAAEPSEWLPPDDGGDAPKSAIQVLTGRQLVSWLAETTIIVFLKTNVFLLANLFMQFLPGMIEIASHASFSNLTGCSP